jgi:hypothetical protein
MSNADVVTALMTAFREQDREAAERLVADRFHFTSPQDDRIDRAAWFDTCFPTTGHFTDHVTLQVLEVEPDLVISRYEYEVADGTRYRNVEAATVEGGQVVEVEVYFGGAV